MFNIAKAVATEMETYSLALYEERHYFKPASTSSSVKCRPPSRFPSYQLTPASLPQAFFYSFQIASAGGFDHTGFASHGCRQSPPCVSLGCWLFSTSWNNFWNVRLFYIRNISACETGFVFLWLVLRGCFLALFDVLGVRRVNMGNIFQDGKIINIFLSQKTVGLRMKKPMIG